VVSARPEKLLMPSLASHAIDVRSRDGRLPPPAEGGGRGAGVS